MIQTLVQSNDFTGKYVAMKSFEDPSVVGYGDTPKEASDKAREKGCEEPVITFLPAKDMVQIY